MQLRDKVAVVTGSGSGIGLGIAQAFHHEGASVVFNDIDPAKAEHVPAERALFVEADVRTSAAMDALVDRAVEEFGGIDVMVNCVGGAPFPGLLNGMPDEAWLATYDLNVHTTFYGTRKALGHMIPQGSGRVINISSVEGKQASGGAANYASAKHAIIGLTKSAAKEVGQFGITVNALCPGVVVTDGVRQSLAAAGLTVEDLLATYVSGSAINRAVTVEEVAALAVFLASDAASGVTGAALSVDGGTASY